MTRLTSAAYAAMVGLILGGAVALSGQSSITPAQFINGGGTPSGPILANTGCTVIPYSFIGRTTTGFCSPAADAVSGYAANTEIWRTTTSGVDIGASAWLFGSAIGTSDIRCRRTATKTLTCDDGAGGVGTFAFTGTISATVDVNVGSSVRAGAFYFNSNRSDIRSPADGEVDIQNNALSASAGVRQRYITEVNTGTKAVGATESRELYNNSGDGDGSIINLPDDPTAGFSTIVAVVAAQTITVNVGTGETIWLAGTSCGTDITGNDTGASLFIFAVTGGSGAVWHAIGSGTWTC